MSLPARGPPVKTVHCVSLIPASIWTENFSPRAGIEPGTSSTRGDKRVQRLLITKTCLYNFDPLKPHFYIVKLGFTGVYIIFLFSAQNIDCGYSLEPPQRGGSNEYPQSMFLSRNMKNIRIFLSENFHFLVVKFSVYLNRRVFVMCTLLSPTDFNGRLSNF